MWVVLISWLSSRSAIERATLMVRWRDLAVRWPDSRAFSSRDLAMGSSGQ